ncbi:MAG: hypothetical protein Q9217_005684 [Psora testacea]
MRFLDQFAEAMKKEGVGAGDMKLLMERHVVNKDTNDDIAKAYAEKGYNLKDSKAWDPKTDRIRRSSNIATSASKQRQSLPNVGANMSASRNADANANQPGQFGSHIEREGPLTTHGHQPGRKVGNDAAPEFSAKTLPPGSAPAHSTFNPNTTSEVPGQALNPDNDRRHGKESTKTAASDTLGGATSRDVHTGMGHPGQGMTSNELRHDGKHTSKKEGSGLAGVGASGASSTNKMVDERTQPKERAYEKEEGINAGTRGGADKQPAAEEREPESAEHV